MVRLRTVNRDWISFWVGVAGFFISVAGVVANVKGEQTSALFWAIIVAGVAFIFLAVFIQLSDTVFRAFVRPFVGSNIVTIERCPAHHIETVHSMASSFFGGSVTSPDLIRTILSRFNDGLQIAVVRNNSLKPYVGGYYFFFPIDKSSVDKIINFEFDVSKIDPECIADRPDRGHAIYIGGIAASGIQVRSELMGALKTKIEVAQKTKSGMAYARAATTRGKHVLEDHGFQPVHPRADDVGCFFQRQFEKKKATVENTNATEFSASARQTTDDKRKKRRAANQKRRSRRNKKKPTAHDISKSGSVA